MISRVGDVLPGNIMSYILSGGKIPIACVKTAFFFFFEFASYVEGMMRSYMEELLSLPSDHGILIFSHFVILKVPSLWRSSEW